MVIGTSLVVYPAAGLVDYAPNGIPKILIDPNNVKEGLISGFKHIKAKAGEGVDELLNILTATGWVRGPRPKTGAAPAQEPN